MGAAYRDDEGSSGPFHPYLIVTCVAIVVEDACIGAGLEGG